jgi:hypothetical protein
MSSAAGNTSSNVYRGPSKIKEVKREKIRTKPSAFFISTEKEYVAPNLGCTSSRDAINRDSAALQSLSPRRSPKIQNPDLAACAMLCGSSDNRYSRVKNAISSVLARRRAVPACRNASPLQRFKVKQSAVGKQPVVTATAKDKHRTTFNDATAGSTS